MVDQIPIKCTCTCICIAVVIKRVNDRNLLLINKTTALKLYVVDYILRFITIRFSIKKVAQWPCADPEFFFQEDPSFPGGGGVPRHGFSEFIM